MHEFAWNLHAPSKVCCVSLVVQLHYGRAQLLHFAAARVERQPCEDGQPVFHDYSRRRARVPVVGRAVLRIGDELPVVTGLQRARAAVERHGDRRESDGSCRNSREYETQW